ncbi:hypothetical protein B0J11DRAFT_115268 [Dendryphion nanum]|uniref:Uncharacterized protein n=1 Tax=Dendryphion nanum TaxID=256645 RepID=A0A9P9D939_9PLEO|nr:hypothetical protein B0J11DRAFT_115268 [Dendryphion nanum]
MGYFRTLKEAMLGQRPEASLSRSPLDSPPPYKDVPSSRIAYMGIEGGNCQDAKASNDECSQEYKFAIPAQPPLPLAPPIVPIAMSKKNGLGKRQYGGKRYKFAQLQKYLIEIITFRIEANLMLVREALDADDNTKPTPISYGSILTDSEKTELMQLATAIDRLYDKYRSKEWVASSEADRESVKTGILKPLEYMKRYFCHADIMELIATYPKHQCDPSKRALAINRSRGKISFSSKEDKTSLAGLEGLIDIISPNGDVRMVLGEALIDLRKRIGVKSIEAKHWLLIDRSNMDKMCELLRAE